MWTVQLFTDSWHYGEATCIIVRSWWMFAFGITNKPNQNQSIYFAGTSFPRGHVRNTRSPTPFSYVQQIVRRWVSSLLDQCELSIPHLLFTSDARIAEVIKSQRTRDERSPHILLSPTISGVITCARDLDMKWPLQRFEIGVINLSWPWINCGCSDCLFDRWRLTVSLPGISSSWVNTRELDSAEHAHPIRSYHSQCWWILPTLPTAVDNLLMSPHNKRVYLWLSDRLFHPLSINYNQYRCEIYSILYCPYGIKIT